MTDALVEKVAREVMGESPIFYLPDCTFPFVYDDERRARRWNPLTDANDLQMIKDKLREMGWMISILIISDDMTKVILFHAPAIKREISVIADTEARAICEAAIKAMEVDNGN